MAAGPLVGILAAAGSGERLGSGGPKAFVPCGGRPLLEWSLEPMADACDRVVVVLPPGFAPAPGSEDAPPPSLRGRAEEIEVVPGGPTRSESVLAGVRAAPEAGAFVVHDAARPLVTLELIDRCVAELDRGWDAAVAAAPVTDTVKEAAADGRVLRTLDRSRLWAVQTPQAFRAEPLVRALEVDPELLAAATDDASLVEATGGEVTVVEAPPENLKVTRSVDLSAAEALLAADAGRRPC